MPGIKPSRSALIAAWLPYLSDQAARGVRPRRVARALGGLFAGQPGAKAWRRLMGELPEGGRAAVAQIRDYLGDYGDAGLEDPDLQAFVAASRDRQSVA